MGRRRREGHRERPNPVPCEQGGSEGRNGCHRGRHPSNRGGSSRALSLHLRENRTKRRRRVRQARKNDRVASIVMTRFSISLVTRPPWAPRFLMRPRSKMESTIRGEFPPEKSRAVR